MSRELTFLPEVSRDFLQAYQYYESSSPERGGGRFEDAFKRAIREIQLGRITHAPAFQHFHRVHLGPFPYTMYYRLHANRAVITAVLYSRYDPKRIKHLLGSRM